MIEGVKVEGRSRTLIFINVIISSVASSLLMTALNTALSPVCNDIGIDVSTGQWLISGEVLAMGIVMPLTAFLMHRFPTRRLYLVGIIIFIAGLVTAMFSQSFPVMMLGRVMQGCGNGTLMSMAQVIILSIYPIEKRGSTMGIFGMATAVSPVIAPTLGGVLSDTAGWRSIFFVDLIIMGFAFVMACIVFKNVLDTEKTRIDILSFVLSILGFGGITLCVGTFSNYGFNSPMVLISLVVGAVGLVIFVWRQLKIPKPFLDIKILKVRDYTVSVISSMLLYFILMGSGVLMPLLVQNVLGRTATIAGLVTLPGSIAMAVISPFSGRLYDRIGIKILYVIGASALLVSNVCMCTFINIDSPLYMASAFNALRYVAVGCIMMPMITWGTSRVKDSQVADASAIIMSFRTIAGSIGSAVFVGIMSTSAARSAATYGDLAEMHGVTMAFTGMAICAAVVLFIAVFVVRGKRREKAAKQE